MNPFLWLLLFFSFFFPLEAQYKMYCMYTPMFKPLYEDYFLPSIKDDFEIIAKEIDQDSSSGIFRSEGWNKTMLKKLELLREAIQENWNNQVFFYSDIDIVFLKPILEEALFQLGKHDFVVQESWPHHRLCAGFFVMRGNEKTLKLITEAHALLEQNKVVDDQLAIQQVLEHLSPDQISWKFLPTDKFPNGRKFMKKSKGHYEPICEIIPNPSALLFHATSCVGIENKYHFLRRVQKESLDIEVLTALRTQQYSLNPYKKIVIFSAPRTGSSVVYNVFKFIFEDPSKIFSRHDNFFNGRTVLKTHRFNEINTLMDHDVLYVFTVRDPIDTALSNYKITTRKNIDAHGFAKELINRYIKYFQFLRQLEQNKFDVLLVKYEDYLEDIDNLFSCIEKKFNLVISEEDKDLMRHGYSKENVYQCTKHLATFAEYLPISGFHGKHVNMQYDESPEEFATWLDFYYNKHKPLFNQYGY